MVQGKVFVFLTLKTGPEQSKHKSSVYLHMLEKNYAFSKDKEKNHIKREIIQ